MSDEKFICKLFKKYLTLKKKYLINYVKDKYIGEMIEDQKYKTVIDIEKWYIYQWEKIKDNEETEYKLIFATLIWYDQSYKTDKIEYIIYKEPKEPSPETLVMAFGNKPWREKNIVLGSNPFQRIRGVFLNEKELDIFNKVNETTNFQKHSYFANDLSVVASHAMKDISLEGIQPENLNFSNRGMEYKNDKNDKNDFITKSIEYATEKTSKILIFPELLISEEIEKNLISKLNEGTSLTLVIAGSRHKKNKAGNLQNISKILFKDTHNTWKELATYSKMIPFSILHKEVNSNIDVENIEISSDVTIMPTKDGVIGIAICRDVMDLLNLHNPMHKYCDFVDLMLVISYSTGDSNMFVGTAECLARWHNCATLYTNAISTAYKKDLPDDKSEISFAIYPQKNPSIGPFSVSGEITYITDPFKKIITSSIQSEPVSILASPGIKHTVFTEEEIKNGCKCYTIGGMTREKTK